MGLRIIRDPVWRGRDLETLEIRCPQCKAKRGQLCQVAITALVPGKPGPQVVGHRPAKVAHNARREALWKKRRRDWLASRPQPQPRAAVQSINQYAQMEHEQMREWLRANWRLFLLRRVDQKEGR